MNTTDTSNTSPASISDRNCVPQANTNHKKAASATRAPGLDLLRCMAIFLVFVTHMMNYSGSVANNSHTIGWRIFVFLRFLAMICVPTFVLLTGYLQQKKQPCRRFYAGIVPILLSWLAISVVCVPIHTIVKGLPAGGIRQLILQVLDGSYGYSWYVKMYVCLFLMIPFLNILMDHLSRNLQKLLIGTLVFLTMLPALANSFQIAGVWVDIIPDYFEGSAYITYYLIGSYIARHRPRPNRLLCAAVALGVLLFEWALCQYYSVAEYAWWFCEDNATVTHAIVTTCVFLICYDWKLQWRPLQAVIKEISICSYEMYLFAFFVDQFLFGYLTIPAWQIMLISFTLSYLAARIARLILVPVSGFLKKCAAGS